MQSLARYRVLYESLLLTRFCIVSRTFLTSTGLAALSVFPSCPFVPFVVQALAQQITPIRVNQVEFMLGTG
jgi:hypothetical protein